MGEENKPKRTPESMILEKLCDIQAEVEAIAKDRRNQQQGYNFRGVEDVLNMIHGLLAKHRVIVVTRRVGEGRLEERPSRGGGLNITRIFDYEFDFMAANGTKLTVGPLPGEGMDTGDKASNKTIANAYKYAVFFTFSVPTKDLVEEPDATSLEAMSGKEAKDSKPEFGVQYKTLLEELGQILSNPKFEKQKKAILNAAGKINPLDVSSLENLVKVWRMRDAEVKKQATEEPAEQDPAKGLEDAGLVDEGASQAFDNA